MFLEHALIRFKRTIGLAQRRQRAKKAPRRIKFDGRLRGSQPSPLHLGETLAQLQFPLFQNNANLIQRVLVLDVIHQGRIPGERQTVR